MIYKNLADRLLQYIKLSNYGSAVDNVNFATMYADVAKVQVELTPEALEAIITSADFDLGAIANELEWVNQFIIQLQKELYLKYSCGNRLDYYGELYGVPRFTGEPDTAYRKRILFYINGRKLTKYAIIDAIQEYFSEPIYIYESQDAAFYDCSFFEFYDSIPAPGLVTPAFIRDEGSKFYFEIWIPIGAFSISDSEIYGFTDIAFYDNEFFSATGTTGLNWNIIFDLIDNTKVAGVGYTIFVER